MIHIPCFPEDLILPIVYAIDATDLNYVRRTVNLSRILPTQCDLFLDVLNFYRQRIRMTDSDNALPYGICFAGSPTIYLTNGHHRWYVCKERGRKRLRMWVLFYHLSLRDALLACLRPPPTISRPTRRVLPIHPQQMPLALYY